MGAATAADAARYGEERGAGMDRREMLVGLVAGAGAALAPSIARGEVATAPPEALVSPGHDSGCFFGADVGPEEGEGGLNVRWIHGSPDSALDSDPPLQVHAFDKDTYILRQNKYLHYEAPFLYLLFGTERALLLDTGAGAPGRTTPLPVGRVVQGVIDQWQAIHDRPSLELVVAHSHSHGDHVAGDDQFTGQRRTRLVPWGEAAVRSFFGFEDWPNRPVSFDLGGRELTILAVPGHLNDHIAVYDPRTRIVLSGDTFYPGHLFVSDRRAYRQSIARLAEFACRQPVRFFLGGHVEMTSAPRLAYRYRTTYQPVEHVLQLQPRHLAELHTVTARMGDALTRRVFDHFILEA